MYNTNLCNSNYLKYFFGLLFLYFDNMIDCSLMNLWKFSQLKMIELWNSVTMFSNTTFLRTPWSLQVFGHCFLLAATVPLTYEKVFIQNYSVYSIQVIIKCRSKLLKMKKMSEKEMSISRTDDKAWKKKKIEQFDFTKSLSIKFCPINKFFFYSFTVRRALSTHFFSFWSIFSWK